jgi:hypothetical protein
MAEARQTPLAEALFDLRLAEPVQPQSELAKTISAWYRAALAQAYLARKSRENQRPRPDRSPGSEPF